MVTGLPDAAVVLAETPEGELQAARFAPTVWGVQVHPEVDVPVLTSWAAGDRDDHLHRGLDQEALLAEIEAALQVTDAPALLFPRRQAVAHRAGILLQLGRVEEALETAREAVATPSEDVRAQVLALRALGSALRASGDEPAARQAVEQALEVARSTRQRSEIAATERLLTA